MTENEEIKAKLTKILHKNAMTIEKASDMFSVIDNYALGEIIIANGNELPSLLIKNGDKESVPIHNTAIEANESPVFAGEILINKANKNGAETYTVKHGEVDVEVEKDENLYYDDNATYIKNIEINELGHVIKVIEGIQPMALVKDVLVDGVSVLDEGRKAQVSFESLVKVEDYNNKISEIDENFEEIAETINTLSATTEEKFIEVDTAITDEFTKVYDEIDEVSLVTAESLTDIDGRLKENKEYIDVVSAKTDSLDTKIDSVKGSLSVPTYAEAVALATDNNKGQVIYVEISTYFTEDGGETNNPEEAKKDENGNPVVKYAAGPYIVIGEGMFFKVSTACSCDDYSEVIKEITAQIASVQTTANTNKTNLETLSGSVNTLSATTSDIAGDVSALSSTTTTLRGDVDKHEKEIYGVLNEETGLREGGLISDISGLKSDISGLKTDISGIETNVGTINQTITKITSDIGNNTTAISNITTQVTNIYTTVETLDKKINGTTDEDGNEIAGVDEKIANLEKEIEDIKNNGTGGDSVSAIIDPEITITAGAPWASVVSKVYTGGTIPAGITIQKFIESLVCVEDYPKPTANSHYYRLVFNSAPSITLKSGSVSSGLVEVGSVLEFNTVSSKAVSTSISQPTVSPFTYGYSDSIDGTINTSKTVSTTYSGSQKSGTYYTLKSSLNGNYELTSGTCPITVTGTTSCTIPNIGIKVGLGSTTYTINETGISHEYEHNGISSYYVVSNLGNRKEDEKSPQINGITKTETNIPTTSATYTVTGVYPVYYNVVNGKYTESASTRLPLQTSSNFTFSNMPSEAGAYPLIFEFPASKEISKITAKSLEGDVDYENYTVVDAGEKNINGVSCNYKRLQTSGTHGAGMTYKITLSSGLNIQ